MQTKQGIPKQRKKIIPSIGREGSKTYQEPDAKEAKQYLGKFW